MIRKENEPQPPIEKELKLPLTQSIEDLTTLLLQISQVHKPRTFERTVMFDVLKPAQPISTIIQFNQLDTGHVVIEADFGSTVVQDFSIFRQILESSGLLSAVSGEGQLIVESSGVHEKVMWNTEACLRYRLFRNENENLLIAGFKKTLEKSPVRREIEYETSFSDEDFLISLLQRHGFEPFFSYERFRTSWTTLQGPSVKIDVDEFPFGNYVEIEGDNERALHSTARKLGLRPEEHITLAYGKLYQRIERENGRVPKDHIVF